MLNLLPLSHAIQIMAIVQIIEQYTTVHTDNPLWTLQDEGTQYGMSINWAKDVGLITIDEAYNYRHSLAKVR